MKYRKPEEPLVMYLDERHRIVSGDYAWCFETKFEGEDRFRFKMNSTSLIVLFHLVREYLLKHSKGKSLTEVLNTVEEFMENAMRSHAVFLKSYLPDERSLDG